MAMLCKINKTKPTLRLKNKPLTRRQQLINNLEIIFDSLIQELDGINQRTSSVKKKIFFFLKIEILILFDRKLKKLLNEEKFFYFIYITLNL